MFGWSAVVVLYHICDIVYCCWLLRSLIIVLSCCHCSSFVHSFISFAELLIKKKNNKKTKKNQMILSLLQGHPMSLTGLKTDPRFEKSQRGIAESNHRIIAITSSCLRIHQRVIQLGDRRFPTVLRIFMQIWSFSHNDFRIEIVNYQHYSTAAFVEGAIGVYKWSVETFGAAIIGALAATLSKYR